MTKTPLQTEVEDRRRVVKLALLKADTTQRSLVMRLGVSESTFGRWMAGLVLPTPEQRAQMEAILGSDPFAGAEEAMAEARSKR